MTSKPEKQSFWMTMPGILTGIAAVIGAITALLATGFFTPEQPTNIAPLADAGSNKTVYEGEKNIPLIGRGIDPNNDLLNYLWRQVSGDYSVKLENENKSTAIFNAPTDLTNDIKLSFELTVNDKKQLSANDNIVIYVLNNRSNDVMLFNKKGWDFYSLKRFEDGIEFHKKASQLDPNNAEALNGIGWALVSLGKKEEGINYFHKALSLSPNNATILNYIGVVLDDIGNFTDAISYYDKALEIDPLYKEPRNNKGVTFTKLGKYNEAIQYFDKVLSIDPQYKLAIDNKKWAIEKLMNNETSNKP